jgi:hypothetical protein
MELAAIFPAISEPSPAKKVCRITNRDGLHRRAFAFGDFSPCFQACFIKPGGMPWPATDS